MDTSGFTRMTQELMKNGQEGAELIAQAINEIFTPAVQIVYENHGFITHFAGDAFNAVFPGKVNCLSELFISAWKNRQSFAKIEHFRTKFGDYLISVKIGLGYGDINWKIIGQDNHYAYYYAGSAINQASESEKKAQKNEIIFPGEFIEKINSAELNIRTRKVDDKYFKLTALIPSSSTKHQRKTLGKEIQNKFYPEILLTGQVNEFRDVISCFISLSGEPDKDHLISEIIKWTDRYQGYFNRVNFGDKGCFVLIFFGAPVTPEDIVERSCSFALKILNLSASLKIGMTYGRAFTGFIGSNSRAEYTAQGSSVNLAARMMTGANPGQIHINQALAKQIDKKFEIVNLGKKNFKGFSNAESIYQLKSSYSASNILTKISDLKTFGRNDSIKFLKQRIDDLLNSCDFQGIVYIDGDMGAGKSHLLDEVQKIYHHGDISWLNCLCNPIIPTSFNPFIFWLKNYFFLETGEQSKFEKFQQIYRELVSTCPDEEIRDELNRTKSMIGALLGIFWEGSLYETLNPRERYNNVFQAMKNLILAKTLSGPVVLRIEDIQHIDNDSLKFINYLLTGIGPYPLLVIATCRRRDNGEFIDLNIDNVQTSRLELKNLDREATKGIVMDIISSTEISEKHLEFIYKESGGNPFYIKQLTQYMMDNNLLDEENTLVNGDFQVPSTINSILIARIDRLERNLKDLVKTAAVIGPSFSLSVLEKINQENYVEVLLDQGIRQNLWLKEQMNLYSFVNLLLCEVAYQMQLKQTLRKIHRNIGQVLEELYRNNLEEYYFEILEHYTRAEEENKIKDYLMKSAKYAKKNYLNELSLKYFQTLLQYYPQPDEISDSTEYSQSEIEFVVKDIIDIIHQTVDIKNILGQWESALQDLKNLKNYLNCYQDDRGNYIYYNNLGLIYYSKADYSMAKKYFKKSLEIAEIIGDRSLIISGLNNVGMLFFQNSQSDQAEQHYQKIVKLTEYLNDQDKLGSALGNLGMVFLKKREFHKAENYFKRALNLFEKVGNKRSMAMTTGNLGTVYFEMGKLDLAIDHYQENLQFRKKTGDKRGVANASINIGNIYSSLGNIDQAKEWINRGLKSAEDLGDLHVLALGFGYLEVIYFNQGQYKTAMDNLNQAEVYIKKMANPLLKTVLYLEKAKINKMWRNWDQVILFAELAEQLSIKHNLKYYLSHALFLKAEWNFHFNHYNQAESIARQASELSQKQNHIEIFYKSEILINQIMILASTSSSDLNRLLQLMLDFINNIQEGLYKALGFYEFTKLLYNVKVEHKFDREKFKQISLSLLNNLDETKKTMEIKNKIREIECWE